MALLRRVRRIDEQHPSNFFRVEVLAGLYRPEPRDESRTAEIICNPIQSSEAQQVMRMLQA